MDGADPQPDAEPEPPKIKRKEVRWFVHPDLVDCLDQLIEKKRGRYGMGRGQVIEYLAWEALKPFFASGDVEDPASRK